MQNTYLKYLCFKMLASTAPEYVISRPENIFLKILRGISGLQTAVDQSAFADETEHL